MKDLRTLDAARLAAGRPDFSGTPIVFPQQPSAAIYDLVIENGRVMDPNVVRSGTLVDGALPGQAVRITRR